MGVNNLTPIKWPTVLIDSHKWPTVLVDSHKWPSVLVDEVKGKPRNFEACLCGSLYSTFTTYFQPHAFYNKRFKCFSKTNSTDPGQWFL